MNEHPNSSLARAALLLALGSAALAPVVGCAGETDTGGDPNAPSFPEGTGQLPAADADAAYPSPPYGFYLGAVMPNYEFYGYARPVDEVEGPMRSIRFSDFYNPTGTDVYPEGSPFPAGSPKPTALMFDISALWCPVCKDEAKNTLPGRYEQYAPDGGQFLVVLLQGASGYSEYDPATNSDINIWGKLYDPVFPLVLDPTEQLSAIMPANAFPANLIIDTRTMKLVMTCAGGPAYCRDADDTSFWTVFQQVMAGTYQIPAG